jgi:hypothetical protein
MGWALGEQSEEQKLKVGCTEFAAAGQAVATHEAPLEAPLEAMSKATSAVPPSTAVVVADGVEDIM